MPMESSRIESGNEESSVEKSSPKAILQGIQPLDIRCVSKFYNIF